MVNRQITLARRPQGFPRETDFALVESPVPEPGPGQALVRVKYLSVDPYQRGRMADRKSYAPPVQIGQVMEGGAVGEVVASRSQRFQPGDIAQGQLGWQEYDLADAASLRKVDPGLGPISTSLGVLGMPGMTAYFGLLDIGRPRAGETVVVSGAAGAVGSLAGQIAKIQGCRVVGIAGSDAKVDWITADLGLDAAFNYKTTPDHRARLAELCPHGVDVYFDNVGGAISDAVLLSINDRARIVVCGQISQYNLEKPELAPRLVFQLVIHRARMEGFLIFDYAARFEEGISRMAGWMREGLLKYREDIAAGLENAPAAFIGMLRGANTGKQLVKVAD